MDRSVERRLLLAATRAFLEEKSSSELELLLAGPVAWDRLVDGAERERLAAILYTSLRPFPVPRRVLDRLRAAWVSGQRQYLMGVEQLSRVVSLFEQQGVPAIPLRGPALAGILYRDPALRPFTDLDLLLPEAELPQALSLLSRLGYRHLEAGHSLGHQTMWRHAAAFVGAEDRPDDLPLDLHWGLVDYPGVSPLAAIDHGALWERAVRVEGRAEARWTLCPVDLLVYLALHLAVHHALSGLIWQLDLALLLRRLAGTLDWDGVADRAQRWRVRGALSFALRVTQEHFDTPVPIAMLARLWPPGLQQSVVERLRRRREGGMERLDYLVPFLLMDRRTDIVRALLRAVLPPADWLRCRYEKGSLLGAYSAHLARLSKVSLQTVRATASREARPAGGGTKQAE